MKKLTLGALCFLLLLSMGAWGCGGGDGTTTTPLVPFVSPPNDTLYGLLWHLRNLGQMGPAGGTATAGEDIRAEPAWAQGVTGTGVRIVVIDSGVRIAHPDLTQNAVAGAHGVPNAGNTDVIAGDPTPLVFDAMENHGTNVAGTACAVGHNDLGVTGIAPRAGLVAVRDPGIVAVECAARVWNLASNHVYNMSFGVDENGYYTQPDACEIAAITMGLAARGGRGAVYIQASGNGAANHHANLDGFNNLRGVIVINGVNAAGTQPNGYAQNGACIVASTPSSDENSMPVDNLPDLVTTDLNPGGATTEKVAGLPDYMTGFGQTSGAAPLASGVVALMLERNPNLTWRDVRRILAFTARRNDLASPGWVINDMGAGRPVHPSYGFGVIDAGAAVMMANGFTTLGIANTPPIAGNPGEAALNMAIPDNNAAGLMRTTMVATAQTVDEVALRINLNHGNYRHLRILLTSPRGTVSELTIPDATKNMVPAGQTGMIPINGELRLTTVRPMGETSMGTWSLQVADEVAGTAGMLVSWELEIFAD